jgi:hypothetical protein
MGPYIADFLCFDARLVVELDGNQHAAQAGYDAIRDAWFRKEGFRVMRFSDRAALTEINGVLESIWSVLNTLTRPAGEARRAPSPIQGEGKRAKNKEQRMSSNEQGVRSEERRKGKES